MLGGLPRQDLATGGYILTRAISIKVREAKARARQKPGKGRRQKLLKFHIKSTSKTYLRISTGTSLESTTGTFAPVPKLVIVHSIILKNIAHVFCIFLTYNYLLEIIIQNMLIIFIIVIFFFRQTTNKYKH